ncbi:MAG: amidase family protein, partial [Gammaproteobacteria bacterium]|nr:amidase family protein [Gammaproteobacteria bacterium]
MEFSTIAELSGELQSKRISSVEATRLFLDRIERLDKQINSYVTVCHEQALMQAQFADKELAAGRKAPLLGIPIAHKDIFCTSGVKTSCGSKMLDNFFAPYNATVVEKLDKSGAVMLGKTNMDEFAMGSSSE